MGENRFVIHNAQWTPIPLEVLRDKKLTSSAKVLYGILLAHAGSTGSTDVSEKELTVELGMSTATIERAMRELNGNHWILRNRRFESTSVTLVFLSQADCIAYEKRYFL